MMDKRCDGCKFWVDLNRPEMEGFSREGECRKYPPSMSQNWIKFPRTANNDWCGEHQPKDTTND